MVDRIFPKKIEQGAFLQLILLHSLYSQSKTESILFQGGTALRWVYGGQRASEDLDFVSPIPRNQLQKTIGQTFKTTSLLATPQFGPGNFDEKPARSSDACLRTYAIYRPDHQRERIAVRIEVEKLVSNGLPEYRKIPFMDCPSIFAAMRNGSLTLPYSSSMITVETPEEILTDKLRALFERSYLKGRDLYDLWFLHSMLGARASVGQLQKKLKSYTRPFHPARKGTFFLKRENRKTLEQILESDLRPFLPSTTYKELKSSAFATIFKALMEIFDPLLKEGFEEVIDSYAQTFDR